MRCLYAIVLAFLLLFPAGSPAWDFENAPETATGGDMPTEENTPGASHDRKNTRSRDFKRHQKNYREYKKRHEATPDSGPHGRYLPRANGCVYDLETGKTFVPGERLPTGHHFIPPESEDDHLILTK